MQVTRIRNRPLWLEHLRNHIISRGIKAMCGSADAISTAATTDTPLVSAAVRLGWLKALGAIGVKNFVTKSGLGYNFVCHTGDLANYPFYYRRAYQAELELVATWLQGVNSPVIYDVGANDGFFSTHLAQILAGRFPKIYAFEPVPSTFTKLVQSVQRLGLRGPIHPVQAAVVDDPGVVWISHSEGKSVLAQVSRGRLNHRVGDKLTQVEGITLDGFYSSEGAFPNLLKIDVEGSEVAVLRGAQGLLSRPDRPAILFEYNPITLTECGAAVQTLLELLPGYALHYVDDLSGQKIPFGSPVQAENIDWICNLFAVPLTEYSNRRWATVLKASPSSVTIP